MKRIISCLMIAVCLSLLAPTIAIGESSNTLGCTVTSFSMFYRMLMESLGQETSVKREWISDNQVTIQLTDNSFCLATTDSDSDFANICEALFTAAPESEDALLSAMYSMVVTINLFDPELEVDDSINLVFDILPENEVYYTNNCKYRYVNQDNVYMLYISPKDDVGDELSFLPGEYVVGEDIPAGTYRIEIEDNTKSAIVLINEPGEQGHTIMYETLGKYGGTDAIGKVTVEDGYLVYINSSAVRFTEYKK